MSLRNGIKRSRGEKRWEEVVMLVEVVGLDGAEDLVGPTVIISGKKQSRLVWLF